MPGNGIACRPRESSFRSVEDSRSGCAERRSAGRLRRGAPLAEGGRMRSLLRCLACQHQPFPTAIVENGQNSDRPCCARRRGRRGTHPPLPGARPPSADRGTIRSRGSGNGHQAASPTAPQTGTFAPVQLQAACRGAPSSSQRRSPRGPRPPTRRSVSGLRRAQPARRFRHGPDVPPRPIRHTPSEAARQPSSFGSPPGHARRGSHRRAPGCRASCGSLRTRRSRRPYRRVSGALPRCPRGSGSSSRPAPSPPLVR